MLKKLSFILAILFLFPNFLFAEDDTNISYAELNIIDDSKFKEGIDYKVLYFFSYGCHYCYNIENYKQHFINNKPENVEFINVPITAIPSWINYTRAYYIAESLNLDIRKNIFEKIHIKEEKILTEEQLRDFFKKEYNVDELTFKKYYNSFSIKFKEKENENLIEKYEITGTPNIIVLYRDGRVFKTSPSITGGLKDTILSLIYLIKNQ